MRAFAAGVCAALAPLVLLVTAGPAQAAGYPARAAGYRYWSFWQAEGGAWTYATEGPATARPADGSVHGFRFSVSEDSSDSAQPRRAPDFAVICGATAPKADTKRIALVIDPGTRADAPEGETPPGPRVACARVPEGATTAEALARVAKPLRYGSDALLCAISGYPKTGCGEQVSAQRPTAPPSAPASAAAGDDSGAPASPPAADGDSDGDSGDDSGGPAVGLPAGAAVLAALGAATLWRSRRRTR